ncbi:MAG TPA: efflux RND transporter permease subunit [Bacteroidetes bacterium]|nr:efflux RND transporter permease subunit [Bacteroidota bacterium]
MSLPELAVKRRVTTAMVMAIIVVVGSISFFKLGLDLLPDIDYPVVSVITTYSGASPEDVETLLTRPVEEIVSQVNRVKKVTSISQEGASIVMVEFEWGTNLDFAAQDIRDRLGLFRQFLPEAASDPLVVKFNVSQFPILGYGFVGDMETKDLTDFVKDNVANRLERIDGVASCVVESPEVREIAVAVDKAALEARGLALSDVVNALRAANLTLPGGYLVDGYREFRVRTVGEFRSLDEIGATIVGMSKSGAPIHLRDIARVEDTY